jgi:hypothetical protein
MIDTMVSTVIAAVNPTLLEPVWIYFIGPPGSGKTETVAPLEDYKFCTFVSSLTENTFASGFRGDDGSDPSLLLQLDGQVVVVKDISSLTSMSEKSIMKIWGDLRDAYDGSYSKASGTVGLTKYKARFGIIMCCTGAIDAFVEDHQQLGERFLAIRCQRTPMGLADRQDLAIRVSESMDTKTSWRALLKTTMTQQLARVQKFIIDNPGLPTIDKTTHHDILLMANFLSMLRTAPVKENAESPELPTRLAQQLLTVGHAHAIADGRMAWNQSDRSLVRRVAVDTFPVTKRRIIQYMFNRGEHRPYSTFKYLLGRARIRRKLLQLTLMQYEFMKIVETDIDPDEGEIRGYRLTKDIWDALNQTKFFEGDHIPK